MKRGMIYVIYKEIIDPTIDIIYMIYINGKNDKR